VSNPVILYILDCKHVQPGKIVTREMQCFNCDDGKMHKVVDVHVYEWRVVCSCNYRPWCGLSQKLANFTCNGHLRKHQSHTAKVLYLQNPYAVKIRDRLNEA
jgi:hypothetical protein